MFSLLPAVQGQGLRIENYWVWCGSVIRGDDGRYHMFASRWPKHTPFHPGWLLNSEIVRAVADRPEGPYEFCDVVFPARGPEYWDGCSTHNPQIRRHQGKYILFYMGTRHPLKPLEPHEKIDNQDPRTVVARSNKRIGIAVADSVQGPWTRMDEPILLPRPNTFYSYFTSNPCPIIRPDGSVYLMFKTRKYNGYQHSSMMIGVASAPSWQGPYRVISDQPIFGPDQFGEVEDPFVWLDSQGTYHLLVKDMSGQICGERAAGVLAHSPDGLHWTLDANPKAYSRTVQWQHGETTTLALFERPFLLFEDGKPTCLLAAVADRYPYVHNDGNTWNQAFRIQHA